MLSQQKLLMMLGDAAVHSGNELAEELGVSRAAVWKQLEQLRALGLDIQAGAGQGYQLVQGYEALDASVIQANLSEPAANVLQQLDVLWECDSTNNVLLEQQRKAPVAEGVATACIAELQTSGRGRRGRQWQSPPGCGIWVSVSWTWGSAPADLSALSLAVGARVLQKLQGYGAPDLAVKWPNDLLARGQKLGGILIDIQGDLAGPLTVVVGLGLNVVVPQSIRSAVAADGGRMPIGITELGVAQSRNQIAADIISTLSDVLRNYADEGFAVDKDYWCRHDYLRDKLVKVEGAEAISGTALGVNDQGFLRIGTAAGEQLVGSGDVSLRLQVSDI